MPHSPGFVGKCILLNKRAAKEIILCNSRLLTVFQHGFLHGVIGVGLAGQPHKEYQPAVPGGLGPQRFHFHMVLRDGSGLIHTEDRDGSQSLDRRQMTHQRVLLSQPPCSHGEKDGENHGKFLRYHGHGQGDSRQNAFDQAFLEGITGQIDVREGADEEKQQRCDSRTDGDQALRLLLKRSHHLFRFQNVASRLSVFRGRTCLFHQNISISLYGQGACVAEIVFPVAFAALRFRGRIGIGRPGMLPDTDRFTGKR